jgi:hypothetical protein
LRSPRWHYHITAQEVITQHFYFHYYSYKQVCRVIIKTKGVEFRHLLACSMGGRWDWLLRRLESAPLNAFPLCSPQGHFQNLKVAAPLFFSLHKVNVSKLPRPYITKKALRFARLSSFGWKMGLLPSSINPFSINLTPHFRVTQFFGISIGNKDTKNKSIRNKSLKIKIITYSKYILLIPQLDT